MEPFWMVLGITKNRVTLEYEALNGCKKMHETFVQAEEEAQRLARNNSGQYFVLISSTSWAYVHDKPIPPPVRVTNLKDVV